MESSKLNIDVVAFDAGGAELLSSMVQNELEKYNWRLITPDNSPAKAIFERKGLSKLIVNKCVPENIFQNWLKVRPDYLFCGTGTNGFELDFIKKARLEGIISIAFLDHWINYKERFNYPGANWTKNRPDYFALSDNRAYGIAEKLNLGQLLQIKNYYIADLLSELDRYDSNETKTKNLLFISEAVEEHCLVKYNDAKFMGYTQTQVLTEILDNFQNLSHKLKCDSLIVRLHPAEASDKFDSLIEKYPNINITVEQAGDRPLHESIITAQAVIGIQSMALLIAFLLDKPVVSYIPIDRYCSLPLPTECCTHDLDRVPKIRTIPCFKADGGLSFYEKYPLDKMLAGIKENSFDCPGSY